MICQYDYYIFAVTSYLRLGTCFLFGETHSGLLDDLSMKSDPLLLDFLAVLGRERVHRVSGIWCCCELLALICCAKRSVIGCSRYVVPYLCGLLEVCRIYGS